MKISFNAVDKPDAATTSGILRLEKETFGNDALSEYVILPLMRHGRVFTAADEDGKPVASAYFMRDMYDSALAYQMSVTLLPEFAGFGIETALLEFAYADLKPLGISKVQLTVNPANFKALSAYREKLGFLVSGSEDEYGALDERLVMTKEL